MSQSPLGGFDEVESTDPYLVAWRTINRLMRRGHSWSGNERNVAYLNTGDGSFAEFSHVAGFDRDQDGRALATIDWDLDGDMDVFVTSRNAPRLRLQSNSMTSAEEAQLAEWLPRTFALRLQGKSSNRDAIGARVEAYTRGNKVPTVRAVRAGEGYLAQSSRWLHFAVAADELDRIVVHWPGGVSQTVAGVDGSGPYVLIEGERAVPFDRSGRNVEHLDIEDYSGPAPPGLVLSSSIPLPSITVTPAAGEPLSLFGIKPGGKGIGTGRPVFLNLWSSTCAPCVGELTEFAKRAEDLVAEGVAFLALSVDEDADAAAALMERIEWPFAWATAPQATIDILDAVHGALLDTDERMPLPTSFLIDGEGEVRVLYRGPVEVDELFRDLSLVDATAEEQLARALPLPGLGFWHRAPERDLSFLEARFNRQGLPSVAAQYARAAIQVVEKSRAELLHSFGRDHAAQGNLAAALNTMQQAVEEDPRFFPARLDLGVLFQQLEQPHDAIGAYLAALELEPEHADAHFNLAIAYLSTRQFASAERERDRLRELASPLAEKLTEILSQIRDQERR